MPALSFFTRLFRTSCFLTVWNLVLFLLEKSQLPGGFDARGKRKNECGYICYRLACLYTQKTDHMRKDKDHRKEKQPLTGQ